MIDAIVTAIPTGIIGWIVGTAYGASAAAKGTPLAEIQTTAELLGNLLGIVLGWIYYAGMESSSAQATLGKMALGVQVVDLSGERLGFRQATGRYFSKIPSALILGIGFLMVGWTARKQGLHDMIAGTLVVKKGTMAQSNVF